MNDILAGLVEDETNRIYVSTAENPDGELLLGKEVINWLNETVEAERERCEIILAEVIDGLYITNKEGFCDYKNKTHKLGWFKETVKSVFHQAINSKAN